MAKKRKKITDTEKDFGLKKTKKLDLDEPKEDTASSLVVSKVQKSVPDKFAGHAQMIFGLSGKKLTEGEKEFFLKSKPLGFILFDRNIETKDQLLELTSSLKGLFTERQPLIFIDQEGGRVARIKPPIAKKLYPAAGDFADMYLTDKDKAKNAVKENYSELMAELRTFSIDSPCAPVCDIRYEGADGVIGDRAFGNNVLQVIDLCKEAIRAINKQGGIPFVKHIPSHGRASVDSHFALPVVGTSLETLEATDFRVFKELAGEKVWGMTAHIVYKALDAEKPATLSTKVIKYIRDIIGFKGPLVTDDICMYALHGETGAKKFLLKNIMTLAGQGKEWRDKYLESWKKLFTVDISKKSDEEVMKLCQDKQLEVQLEFCKALSNIAKESREAGCDIVLHCNGDLQEMEAIYL